MHGANPVHPQGLLPLHGNSVHGGMQYKCTISTGLVGQTDQLSHDQRLGSSLTPSNYSKDGETGTLFAYSAFSCSHTCSRPPGLKPQPYPKARQFGRVLTPQLCWCHTVCPSFPFVGGILTQHNEHILQPYSVSRTFKNKEHSQASSVHTGG
jgi:hypothetical protein